MKLLALDIESLSLVADFGIILCIGFKEVGVGRAEVMSLMDYNFDARDLFKAEKQLLKDVSKRMLEADVWLTHYGQRFDIPYINSRLLYHNLPTLPTTFPHIDTWKVARNTLKLSSNRLKSISTFLGTDDEKNAIRPGIWVRALGGHEPSMRYIVDHCRLDVLVLEEVYNRIRCLVTEHPNKGLIDGRGGCTICGSLHIQKRGFHVTRTRKYQRFQCQDCGGWSKGLKPLEIATRR